MDSRSTQRGTDRGERTRLIGNRRTFGAADKRVARDAQAGGSCSYEEDAGRPNSPSFARSGTRRSSRTAEHAIQWWEQTVQRVYRAMGNTTQGTLSARYVVRRSRLDRDGDEQYAKVRLPRASRMTESAGTDRARPDVLTLINPVRPTLRGDNHPAARARMKRVAALGYELRATAAP